MRSKFLLAIIGIGALLLGYDCFIRQPALKHSSFDASIASQPWAGLKVQFAGSSLPEAKQVVVLLHGYGASGSDLLGLAEPLGGDSRAFVFPEAPISLGPDQFAWATSEQELEVSRLRVIALLKSLAASHPNAKISVGGFSQGAAISSMLLSEPQLKIENLFLYSPGYFIDKHPPQTGSSTSVLLAHGREDKMLPFSAAERLHKELSEAGIKVNWQPFSGGHTITVEAIEATRQQLNQ